MGGCRQDRDCDGVAELLDFLRTIFVLLCVMGVVPALLTAGMIWLLYVELGVLGIWPALCAGAGVGAGVAGVVVLSGWQRE